MSKVSIIIPVYNTEKYLKKCLDSIINQTFREIEIICVNDGSKDNSLKILKEYQKKDSRIVVIDKENSGVSEARNTGVMKSTGEFIMFVDSDDWLELDAVESAYNAITQNSVDVVKFNCITDNSYKNEEFLKGNLYDLGGKTFSTSQSEFVDLINIRVLKGDLYCSVCLLMLRKEVLLKTSLFVKGIPYAEDCIFFNEMLDKIDTIYFLDKYLYHYYRNSTSCTLSSEYYLRNIYGCARAYEKLIEIIKNDKFEKKNREEVIANRFGPIIMSSLFLVYLEEKQTVKKFKKMLEELINDNTIIIILKNTDISTYPLHLAIPFKLFIRKRIRALIAFYDIRKFCRKVKCFLKK